MEAQDVMPLQPFIQDLLTGTVRRSAFTQWELELLLDLQTCRVRKAARPEMLRRYLRALQAQYAKNPATPPLRLAAFLEWEASRRNLPEEIEMEAASPMLSTGLSSR